MSPSHAGALLGRDEILAHLDRALDPGATGGGVTLIDGAAGIGKSAVLGWAVDFARSRGFHVLSATGVSTETQLPYAGLHRLLVGLRDRIPTLPPSLRDAADGLFTRSISPEGNDFYALALAVFTLLTDRAEDAPVLVVVDDLQWLDQPTKDVLGFIARRVSDDPIQLLWARRDDLPVEPVDESVHRFSLEPLDDTSARRLVEAYADALGAAGIRTVLAQARGNPLALIELPRAVLRRSFAHDHDPIPLTDRLERAFAADLSEMADDALDFLLIVSLNDSDSLHEALRATAILRGEVVDREVARAALAARIISIDGDRVAFRHPLIRSAVVTHTSAARQRAAQGALAEALAAIPGRRIWHRALSISGADESVARELEATAAQAQVFQDVRVAAAAFELSAQLTAAPGHKAMRLLRAATCFFQAGHLDVALRLTHDAESVATDDLQRAHIGWLREFLPGGSLESGRGVGQAMRIVHDMYSGGDHDGALRTLATVAVMVWTISPDAASRQQVVDAADRMDEPFEDPRMLYIRAFAEPHDYAGRIIDAVASRSPGDVGAEEAQLLAYALSAIGEFERQPLYMVPALDALARQGNLVERGQNLIAYAWNQIYRGDFRGAQDSIDECIRLCDDTGQVTSRETSRLVAAVIASATGDRDAVATFLAQADALGTTNQNLAGRAIAQLVRGMNAVAAGDHRQAIGELMPIIDPQSLLHHPIWSLFGYIEYAQARSHLPEEHDDHDLASYYTRLSESSGSPLARNAALFAAAIAPASSETAVRTALAADGLRMPFLRARLLLSHGTQLRLEQRAREARSHLRAARDLFDTLGCRAWAHLAVDELAAAGERDPARSPRIGELLTAQESRIATLAAQGYSNKEIAERLYVSHRTVGSHLYAIYPKLGVTNRAQLAAALRAGAADVSPPA